MTNLEKIRELVKATRENKLVTIFPEDKEPINISLSECNIDIAVTLRIKNIGVQFTLLDINTKEKYISKSLDNDLPDTIQVLYMITIRFSYVSGYEGHDLFLGNMFIGKLKGVGKDRYLTHIFHTIELNKKSYF